ncbi:MAG: tRNA pseudouridine synthase B [Phycisphaerae bacterium]|nr:tRNA pseudouridine synthase B [Phycisphaerales bacterium]MCK6477407.1 tRNA pseudouridine(55) synthase TruB [Phycisphaerales bacterium]
MTNVQPPPLCGVLVIDKPLGRTSMNICAVMRAKLRRGGAPRGIKVGHGGTLDPLATGVLVVLVGKATRYCNQIMAGRKRYLATIDLAHTSPTHDHESEFVPFVPQRADFQAPSLQEVSSAIEGFTGTIQQTPPIHSAVNLGGARAYMLAREGMEVPVQPRTVTIDSIRVVSYQWPMLVLDVHCGKGTYMRSLAHDLGRSLGTGGTLEALQRTAAEPYTIEHARSFHELPESLRQDDLLPLPPGLRDPASKPSATPDVGDDQPSAEPPPPGG